MLSWRVIRRSLIAALAAALVVSGFLLSRSPGPEPIVSSPTGSTTGDAQSEQPEQPEQDAPTEKTPRPVVRTEENVVPRATAGAAKNVVAELPQTRTSSYGLVGVTWSPSTDESDFSVTIRSLVNDVWTPWQEIEIEDEAPGEGGRPGTEPIWVGEAQGVAVRVVSASGTRPDDIKVMTIDPGEGATTGETDVTPAANTSSAVMNGAVNAAPAADFGDGAPEYTGPPKIVARPSWGAAVGGTCSAPLVGSSTRGIVVHHTAGNNSYSAADAANIVRGIQTYHIKGHNWCDIGYNFLVDKYGQVFEGRKGGADRAVRAAHSGNGEVNTYAMGISLMGNFDTSVPPEALKGALVKLIGWRMGTTYMNAKGTYKVRENNLTLNFISGHRDVVGTACPGKYAYAWLSESGGLRDRVEAYLSNYSSEIKTRLAGLSATGAIYIGEVDVSGPSGAGRRLQLGNLDIFSKPGKGARTVTASGGFRARYLALGAQASQLWFPIGDSPAVNSNGVFAQRFESGSLFAVRNGSAISVHAIWGRAASVYASLGEADGKLGYPTSSMVAEPGGAKATFSKGYIRYTSATNSAAAYDNAGNPLTTGGSTPPPPPPTNSDADSVTVPADGLFDISGHGYGHGIGMSQHGAQGAARMGATHAGILNFYYPGTDLGTTSGDIRVLITKDTTTSVIVGGRSDLYFRKSLDNKPIILPTKVYGNTVKQWQIVPLTADPTHKSVLQYKTTGGWGTFANVIWPGDAQFEAIPADPEDGTLDLYLPSGIAEYRGALRSAAPKAGSAERDTVNIVSVESYVRGVVAAEMPSSWMPEALKAQAVAARTYGVRGITTSRYYDMCDTTSCQVYRGVAGETSKTDTAVAETKNEILTYQGKPAFTQFSSSSGGWTAAGSQPYLAATYDPYDGKYGSAGNPVHDWAGPVRALFFERAYPAIGKLVSIQITKRDGNGEWGGRVLSMKLVGTKSTVTVTGAALRSKIGLRSTWFAFN